MKNLFNSVKVFKPGSNMFDLSHDVKLSCNMGKLIPIMVMDCIPGDHVKIGCQALVRFAPLVAPIMHRVDVTMHYFFVPNRIVWPGWRDYITNTKVGGALPAFPYITLDGNSYNTSRLFDYMDLPKLTAPNTAKVSAIPFAAYLKIYNEYYRDQNLITEQDDELVDGDNTATLDVTLRSRAWEHDYFTSCLPFAQKGDAVEIPISGQVSLKSTANVPGKIVNSVGHTDLVGDVNTAASSFLQVDEGAGNVHAVYDPNNTLEVANADTTINDLRRATALQRFLEKLARGGSRYIEVIRSMFGVNSSDKRLQRPEYITGVKQAVVISEVLNTTGTTEAPQGNMAGHGVAVVQGNYGSYFAEEHGYIIGIMSVLPRTAYQQGIPRHFSKITDPYEFFWPDFANIGEQEVKNKEIYADQDAANQEGTFGYNPRYSEYKFMPNRVCGDFRTTLDFWHMGRKFGSAPNLNQAFVEADPTTRVFAVDDPDVDHLWIQLLNEVYSRRPMPKFGTPTF